MPEHEDSIVSKIKKNKIKEIIIIKGVADTVHLCRLAAVLEDNRQREVNGWATQLRCSQLIRIVQPSSFENFRPIAFKSHPSSKRKHN